MTFKSSGTPAASATATVAVNLPATAAGDYGVAWIYASGSTATPTMSGWTAVGSPYPDGGGGAVTIFYRTFSSTAGATTVNATASAAGAGVLGYIQLFTSAGTSAPTVLTPNVTGSVAYTESPALTIAASRDVMHVASLIGSRTMGSASNNGTITSTNTTRNANFLLSLVQVSGMSSVVTSASGGTVRRAFTGGNLSSWNFAVIIPPAAPAAPTGLSVSAGVKKVIPTFTPTSGATASRLRWRRTNLASAPSGGTQSSPSWHLGIIPDGVAGGNYGYTDSGDGVVVIPVDTGFLSTHTDFTGRVETGISLISGQAWNTDTLDHGTGVASVAAGTTYGVAKAATVLPVKGLPNEASPGDSIDWGDFLAAVPGLITQLAGRPAVMNFSLGTPNTGDTGYEDFEDAMALLRAANIFVTIAIGNTATNLSSVTLGAAYAGVLFVGGSNSSNGWHSESSYASWLRMIGPGAAVPMASSAGNSSTTTQTGTSFAAPIVMGCAAKVKQRNHELGNQRMLEVLSTQTWDVITGKPSGVTAGLVNSNANTDQWSTTDTFTSGSDLDGFGDGWAIEVQAQSLVGGVWSDWSSSSSATTVGPAAGTMAATAPTVTVAAPTAAWTATSTVPEFTGSLTANAPSVTVEAPTVAWTATSTPPQFTGTMTANAPTVTVEAPTVAWTATSSAPGATGTLDATAPTVTVEAPTVSWTATSTVPSYTGSLAANAPTVDVGVATVAWTGTATAPEFTGTLDATAPTVHIDAPTVAWTATSTPPGVAAASMAADGPMVTVGAPTVAWSAVSSIPVYTGTMLATAPTATVHAPTVLWVGTFTTLPSGDSTLYLGDTPVVLYLGDIPVTLA